MKRGSELGATLIELLASVAILLVVGGVLTESLMVGIDATDRTQRHVSESLDRQLLSRFFTGDVQSADDVHTDTACAGPVEGMDIELTLRWTDGDDTKAVSYLVQAGDGPGQKRLLRHYCVNGVLVSENKLGQNLAEEDPVLSECAAVAGPFGACPTSSPVAPDPPRVALRVRDVSYPECSTGANPQRCEYRIVASRRTAS